LIRAAGDVAVEEKAEFVTKRTIITLKRLHRSLEQQMSDKFIEKRRNMKSLLLAARSRRVNGLAVIGSGVNYSGIVLPIEAEVILVEKRIR